jgi:hypothetical protein
MIAFAHENDTGTAGLAEEADIFSSHTEALGYRSPRDLNINLDDSYTGPAVTIGKMEAALGNPKIKVLLFAGHGNPDGNVICIHGPHDTNNPPPGSQWLIVSNDDYYNANIAWLSKQSCLVVSRLTNLSHIDMIVLSACSASGSGNLNPIAAELTNNLGVGAVVMVGGENAYADYSNDFLEGWPGNDLKPDPKSSFFQLLKTETIADSTNNAAAMVKDNIQQSSMSIYFNGFSASSTSNNSNTVLSP